MHADRWDTEHPERREGEVFLTNVEDAPFFEEFHGIGWKSKRAGSQAYGKDGRPVTGLVPVFVERAELVEAGIIESGDE